MVAHSCIQATFVAASPSDLLWLDQSDLIAAMDEHSEMRACLEKTATADRNVRQRQREREREQERALYASRESKTVRFGAESSTHSHPEFHLATLEQDVSTRSVRCRGFLVVAKVFFTL